MHVAAGMYSQFSQQLTPCLQLTLKGIQRSQTSIPAATALQQHPDMGSLLLRILWISPCERVHRAL